MTGTTLLRASSLMAALLFGACASTDGGTAASGAETADDRVIIVKNHGWEDVRVYAVRGSARLRIGTVSPMNRARFDLEPGMVDPRGYLQLLLRPIAGDDHLLMDEIPVWSGDVVHLDVRNVLALSSFAVHERAIP